MNKKFKIIFAISVFFFASSLNCMVGVNPFNIMRGIVLSGLQRVRTDRFFGPNGFLPNLKKHIPNRILAIRNFFPGSPEDNPDQKVDIVVEQESSLLANVAANPVVQGVRDAIIRAQQLASNSIVNNVAGLGYNAAIRIAALFFKEQLANAGIGAIRDDLGFIIKLLSCSTVGYYIVSKLINNSTKNFVNQKLKMKQELLLIEDQFRAKKDRESLESVIKFIPAQKLSDAIFSSSIERSIANFLCKAKFVKSVNNKSFFSRVKSLFCSSSQMEQGFNYSPLLVLSENALDRLLVVQKISGELDIPIAYVSNSSELNLENALSAIKNFIKNLESENRQVILFIDKISEDSDRFIDEVLKGLPAINNRVLLIFGDDGLCQSQKVYSYVEKVLNIKISDDVELKSIILKYLKYMQISMPGDYKLQLDSTLRPLLEGDVMLQLVQILDKLSYYKIREFFRSIYAQILITKTPISQPDMLSIAMDSSVDPLFVNI